VTKQGRGGVCVAVENIRFSAQVYHRASRERMSSEDSADPGADENLNSLFFSLLAGNLARALELPAARNFRTIGAPSAP
jgi:hypothetical protein